MSEQLRVAGMSLTEFVEGWLRWVEADTEAKPNSLLRLAETDPIRRDRYGYGMHGLMALIAPRVWGDAGSLEDLLLYAVLACYQLHLGTSPTDDWPGPRAHVERAFEHIAAIGEVAAASALRASVAQRAGSNVDLPDFVVRYWADRSLGDRAAHEQEMAKGDLRDLRAAEALDGTPGDPWESMPSVLG